MSSPSWSDLFITIKAQGTKTVASLYRVQDVPSYPLTPKEKGLSMDMRSYRLSCDVTMGDVARHFGVTASTVSAFESNRDQRLRLGMEEIYKEELGRVRKREAFLDSPSEF